MTPILYAMIIGGLGGAFSSILGWLKDEEQFIPKKFVDGLIRATIGGILFATKLELEGTPEEYVLLFIASAGFDVTTNNAWKIVKRVADAL